MTTGGAAVIGLEVHVQLATKTKLFCGDVVDFGGAPNTRVCPVCLGLPGALPVLNAAAVELAVRAALGLDCTVHRVSRFARKNYFYPDLPKGYQVTQYDEPLATGGALRVPGPEGSDGSVVRIQRLHLEEDAGRSLHDRFHDATAIDLNRAGVPLIEIVTEPGIAGPAGARAFLERLQRTLRHLGVSDCDMEKGSLRVDANVSLRSAASGQPGPRTELKNMNSFSGVQRALEYEIARQSALVREGRTVMQETLLWDAASGEARRMRAKEASRDYRYLPDPDLPPVRVDDALLDRVRQSLPELPSAMEARFREQYRLTASDADVLAADPDLAAYFEQVACDVPDAVAASHWVMRDVLGWLNARGLAVAAFPVPPARLAELIRRVLDGAVTRAAAREVLRLMAETGEPAATIIEREGLAAVHDEDELAHWVQATIAAHPAEAARFAGGETRILDFLVGQLMRLSRGRADAARAAALLRARLDG